MRHKLSAALLFLLSTVVLLLSVSSTMLTLTLPADAPQAEHYFVRFRELERNQSTAYRWSYPDSTLMLRGFEHLPVLLDLRVTSTRPIDEPAANLGLARGRWQTGLVPVNGDWRHYYMLVPSQGYQPELDILSTPFRPAERDKRSLGVAVSRVQMSVPARSSSSVASLNALIALGFWRIVGLLALPLLLYAALLRVLKQQTAHAKAELGSDQLSLGMSLLPFLIGCLGCIPIAILAHAPLQTAVLLPDSLRLPLLGSISVLAWVLLHPWLHSQEQWALGLLQSERLRPVVVLSAAALLGTSMLLAMPAWEHPDESSHFEFAWLIAHHATWPTPGTSDPELASINGGGRALHHQPLYHIIVSIMLRLVAERPLEEQLLYARIVSLVLFLGIALIAEHTTRILFPAGHILRWFAPLTLVLNPTFANLMTSVNNDVGVVFVCSLALLLVTHILMQGMTWPRILMLVCLIPLAMAIKNTGAVLLGIVPLVILAAFWQHIPWRRGAWLAVVGLGIILLALMLDWGDAAHWYRWEGAIGGSAMRTERPEAPLGPHVLRLDAVATRGYYGLSSPLVRAGVVANRRVTVGAWVWASRPAHIWAPGVVYQGREQVLIGKHVEVDVNTQPRWIAAIYDIPPRVMFAHLMAWSVAPDNTQPLEIYIDGAVMAVGEYAQAPPPQFTGTGTQVGIWDGQPFQNLIRNSNFEQGWFFLRPQVDQLVSKYARRSPARIVASFADPLTTLRLEVQDYIPWMMFTSFGAYGGRIFLTEAIWQYVIPCISTLALAGLLWSGWRQRQRTDSIAHSCRILALICAGVWGLIFLAHLPVNFPAGIPSARYGFTVMIPTIVLLCAGWLALWPGKLRLASAITLLFGLIILDSAAIASIRLFENSMCIREPLRCIFSPAPALQTQPAILAVGAMLILLLAFVHWKARSDPSV